MIQSIIGIIFYLNSYRRWKMANMQHIDSVVVFIVYLIPLIFQP